MGCMISLNIGQFEIDTWKNGLGANHSELFKISDVKDMTYYYADDYIETNQGLSRKLLSIRKRLDFLGYNLEGAEKIYNKGDLYSEFSFQDYSTVIKSINLQKLSSSYVYIGEYFLLDFIKNYTLSPDNVLSALSSRDSLGISAEYLFCQHPYIILRLLAENKNNENYEVQWKYADVLDGGYLSSFNIDSIDKVFTNSNKILIVTEGKTDTNIIKKAIHELLPDVEDFFQFIDMKNNYPFTGTGNMYNFFAGLIKVNIQRKVIFIFDNDTAGGEAYDKCKELEQLDNIKLYKLPDHDDFNDFRTLGPEGEAKQNINGRAVSIECFLDYDIDEVYIRWTGYNKKREQYQGEIESPGKEKDHLTKLFLEADITNGSYNIEKLNYLLTDLIGVCTELNSAELNNIITVPHHY